MEKLVYIQASTVPLKMYHFDEKKLILNKMAVRSSPPPPHMPTMAEMLNLYDVFWCTVPLKPANYKCSGNFKDVQTALFYCWFSQGNFFTLVKLHAGLGSQSTTKMVCCRVGVGWLDGRAFVSFPAII